MAANPEVMKSGNAAEPVSRHAIALLLQREHILAELEGFLNEIQRDKPAIALCFAEKSLYYKLKEIHHEWDKHHPPEHAIDAMLAEAKSIDEDAKKAVEAAWEDAPAAALAIEPTDTVDHVDRPCPCGNTNKWHDQPEHDVRDHEMS